MLFFTEHDLADKIAGPLPDCFTYAIVLPSVINGQNVQILRNSMVKMSLSFILSEGFKKATQLLWTWIGVDHFHVFVHQIGRRNFPDPK